MESPARGGSDQGAYVRSDTEVVVASRRGNIGGRFINRKVMTAVLKASDWLNCQAEQRNAT